MRIKSILIAACIGLAAFTASAQSNPSVSGSLTNTAKRALDTVTNTGTKNMTAHIPGYHKETVISFVGVNLTGTMAGTARLYGSLDGVNYQRIRSTFLYGGMIDSLAINVNATKYAWKLVDNPFQYYQVQTTGTGTVTFSVAGKYVSH